MSTEDTRTQPDAATATATTVDADATLPAGTPVDAPPIGTAIGRFHTVRAIGAGGMGIVVEAHDPELERRIAIKLMKPSVARDGATSTTRLQREAQAMAKLAHPNVVGVFEAGRWGDQTFIAMELVEGATLREWQKPPRPWRDIVRVYIAAGRGLAAAHAAGLVHRDFKPDNVLVGSDGRPRVTDFGLVSGDRAVTGEVSTGPLSESLTVDGTAMGTPAYMSPEHWAGTGVDARSDQFSFCVSLWEALFGPRPFAGPTIAELRRAVGTGTITPPDERKLPPWLETTLRRGLSRDAAQRWQSMPALLDELERSLAPRRRTPVVVAATALVVAAGAAIAFVATRPAAAPRCPDPRARLVGLWDMTAKEQLHAAFVATGHPEAARTADRFIAAIDERTDVWVGMQEDACEATLVRRTAPQQVLEQRTACLDDRLTELRQLISAFATRSNVDTVDQADDATRALSSLDDCSATGAAATTPALPTAKRAAIANVLRLVGASRAASYVGEFEHSRKLSAEAVAIARTVDDPSTLVSALDVQAKAAVDLEDWELAASAFREGATAAMAIAKYDASARMYAGLMHVLAEGIGDFEAALALRTVAEAALRDAGNPPAIESQLSTALVAALLRSGDLSGALEQARHNLEIARAHLGAQPGTLVEALINVAIIHWELQQFEESARVADEAIRLAEASLGRDHPQTARALQVGGYAAKGKGDLDLAQDLIERALAIRMKRYGLENTGTLDILHYVGNIQRERGQLAAAQATYEQELDLLSRAPGATDRHRYVVLWGLARVHVAEGDFAGATPYFERAFVTAEHVSGRESLEFMKVENEYADSLKIQGKSAEALPHFEHVLAIIAVKLPAYVPDYHGIIAGLHLELGHRAEARTSAHAGLDACAGKCAAETAKELRDILRKASAGR